jgi:hypothetical protein
MWRDAVDEKGRMQRWLFELDKRQRGETDADVQQTKAAKRMAMAAPWLAV